MVKAVLIILMDMIALIMVVIGQKDNSIALILEKYKTKILPNYPLF
jgi:hypothetical protein